MRGVPFKVSLLLISSSSNYVTVHVIVPKQHTTFLLTVKTLQISLNRNCVDDLSVSSWIAVMFIVETESAQTVIMAGRMFCLEGVMKTFTAPILLML